MAIALTHLHYPLDVKKCLKIASKAYINAEEYTDNSGVYKPGQSIDHWLVGRHQHEYFDLVMKDLNIKGRPRFYWLEADTVLDEHVDFNTTCSVNFVLSENAAPVTVGGQDFFYKQGLLNTTIPHSVTNSGTERILLKFSIFDVSYEDVLKLIPSEYLGESNII